MYWKTVNFGLSQSGMQRAVAAVVALDVMLCDFLRMRVRKREPRSSVAFRGFFLRREQACC